MEELRVTKRVKEARHQAKKCRRNGNVPGILYGKDIRNLMFEIGELELNSLVSSYGEHSVIDLNVDGEKYKTLMKDVQRDPVTGKFIHVDLESVDGTKQIISNIPIHFVGEELAGKRGAIIQKEKSSVKVKCTPDNLPRYLDVDISKGRVGSTYKLSDVEIGSEISVLDNLDSVIASISYEQKIVEADDLEGQE
ncbi:large subunit ribosomal protein L25 [Clostridium cavendishii DSM 21758]|uniref:Large ribosomal subunit protein bL25 n=1 Tax=Clostridium cavendishii DSM 21758 TaxID=1121302 RepID=A0A1M6KS40_9CLOT|nr:50S ribosomal protein L25 [Clostridium cavendishii]SHJ61710.1 large subunit ribosomal protein L25 [Clostridium cavendishii DSM 21758]